jgi:hypothetical protein
MAIQIRRGTNAERQLITPVIGELIYTTDTKKVYIGDGTTLGGVQITGDVNGGGDDGDDGDDGGGGGLAELVLDTTPQLGGELDLNTNDITGTGNIDITGSISVTGNVTADKVFGFLHGSIFSTTEFEGVQEDVLVLDSTDRIFYGRVSTGLCEVGNDSITGTRFSIGTNESPLSDLTLTLDNNLQFRYALSNSQAGSGKFIALTASKGTTQVPAPMLPGDRLGGISMRGYTGINSIGFAGLIRFNVDNTATITNGSNFIKSEIVFLAASNTGANGADAVVINSEGVVLANAFSARKSFRLPVYADDSARLTNIPSPVKGTMVFMTSGTAPAVTNKTVVYDGTEWVALH